MKTPSRNRIDWQALHARVSAAQSAIAASRQVSSQQRDLVLQARARRHAKEAEQTADGREPMDVVEFQVAHEAYALACAFVTEVAPLGDYAALPNVSPFVLGVTGLRGRMVSVVDLGRLFDLPSAGLTDRNRVLVVSAGSMEFGVLADRVDSVRRIFVDQLAPPLPTLTGLRSRLCHGILPGGRVLLHAESLLAEKAILNETL